MNMTQKGAWFGVYLSLLLLAIAIVDLTGILDYKGFPTPGIIVFHTFLAVVFLFLPIAWLNRSRKRSKSVQDERDKLIIKRAVLAAFLSLTGVFIIGYIITLFAIKTTASMPAGKLPEILYGGAIIFILVLSVAVLVQYSWGGKGEKS